MENPAVNKTHNCERFCKMPCSDFTLNSPLNKECIEAVDACKCRPIWKDPAFWLIGGLIFSVVVTVVRFIYMYLKDKKAKQEGIVAGAGRAAGATRDRATTPSSAKEVRDSDPAKGGLPPAQSFVVESSVAENAL